jgi:hypothetical protein
MPNGHKIFQMIIKYNNTFHSKALQNFTQIGIYEPSGNPAQETVEESILLHHFKTLPSVAQTKYFETGRRTPKVYKAIFLSSTNLFSFVAPNALVGFDLTSLNSTEVYDTTRQRRRAWAIKPLKAELRKIGPIDLLPCIVRMCNKCVRVVCMQGEQICRFFSAHWVIVFMQTVFENLKRGPTVVNSEVVCRIGSWSPCLYASFLACFCTTV